MFRVEVLNGEDKPVNVMVAQTILNDHSKQTMKIQNPEKPWITGNVFVRPYLNCLSQDDASLVDIIRNEYLVPYDGSEYNFTKPVDELDDER